MIQNEGFDDNRFPQFQATLEAEMKLTRDAPDYAGEPYDLISTLDSSG